VESFEGCKRESERCRSEGRAVSRQRSCIRRRLAHAGMTQMSLALRPGLHHYMPGLADMDERTTGKALAQMSFDRACFRGESDGESASGASTVIDGRIQRWRAKTTHPCR
jgi:hypothetical protein